MFNYIQNMQSINCTNGNILCNCFCSYSIFKDSYILEALFDNEIIIVIFLLLDKHFKLIP